MQGFGDRQLAKLTSLLKQGRIWALNVGENFSVSLAAWEEFTAALPETLVSYIYVSEHKLRGTDMKNRMRTAIRYNRKILGPRDPVLCAYVTNMWFNPPAPGRCTAGQPLTIDTASSLKEAPSISVVSARRKRDLERIKSRREALAAAGMPPPRTPVDTSVLQPTVANMKRFQFVDFLELPARVRVSPLPPAPLHPAAAACIAYMHHTVSSSAQSIPSALELQQDVSLRETQQPEEGLQILPLALPAAYVDRASASPRSGASSAFRLDCGVDAADVHDHGASAEVRSPAGARVSRMCGRAAPTVPGAAVGCQAEPTRRSKRAVKKRAWADDSDEEGGGKAVTQGLLPSVCSLLLIPCVFPEFGTASVIVMVRHIAAALPHSLAVSVDWLCVDAVRGCCKGKCVS